MHSRSSNYAGKAHCDSNPQLNTSILAAQKINAVMNIRLLFFNAPAGAHRANRRRGRSGTCAIRCSKNFCTSGF